MSYNLRWVPEGVIKHFYGTLTNHDMIQSVIDSESDVRFDSLRYVINDFLECTSYAVPGEIVDQIAVMDCGASHTNPHIRIAVVTTAPEVVALAARYVQSPVHRYQTRLFTTMEEARAWLNSSS